jgi:hypothetical protein
LLDEPTHGLTEMVIPKERSQNVARVDPAVEAVALGGLKQGPHRPGEVGARVRLGLGERLADDDGLDDEWYSGTATSSAKLISAKGTEFGQL